MPTQWNTETTLAGYTDGTIVASPDGRYLANTSGSVVRTFDWQEEVNLSANAAGYWGSIAWSPDGRYIVTDRTDGGMHVFETHTWNELPDSPMHTGTDPTSFDWGERYLYFQDESPSPSEIKRVNPAGWDIDTIQQMDNPAGNGFHSDPRGNYLAVGDGDELLIYDVEGFSIETSITGITSDTGAPWTVRWSPQGNYIACSPEEGGFGDRDMWIVYRSDWSTEQIDGGADGWHEFSWVEDSTGTLYLLACMTDASFEDHYIYIWSAPDWTLEEIFTQATGAYRDFRTMLINSDRWVGWGISGSGDLEIKYGREDMFQVGGSVQMEDGTAVSGAEVTAVQDDAENSRILHEGPTDANGEYSFWALNNDEEPLNLTVRYDDGSQYHAYNLPKVTR